jgi:hypothetical protein
LLDDSQDAKIKSYPTVFGFEPDYKFFHVWGSSCGHDHRQVGSTKDGLSDLPDSATRRRRTLKEVFNITEHQKVNPTKILGLDLERFNYPLRVSDRIIWPQSNEKKVASVKTAYQMVISRPVVDWCRQDGIIPVITHPLTNGRSVQVPVGPYLDKLNNPYPPGSCFRAADLYLHFGMRLHIDHNEAWRSNSDTLSSIMLRYPPKNSLPLTMPENERKSPYAEMKRIIAKIPREGMDIHRSGGNVAVKGNAPPGFGAKSAGEGAFFEHEQTIKNPYNYAIETVSESARPLAVVAAGSLLPKEFYDQTNHAHSTHCQH